MDPERAQWNARHKALRAALSKTERRGEAVELFMQQHAMVQATQVSNCGLQTFEDEVWDGLDEPAFRAIPAGMEHSIAWVFWHLTRIEDMTMNVLAVGGEQIYERDGWHARLGATARDTGNSMAPGEITALSAALDMDALRDYRLAVGRQTRKMVAGLTFEEITSPVRQERLQRLLDEGAVLPEAAGLLEYWGGLTVAGLLLMPPTRHGLVHINEALKIKKKVMR
jgi:hypothetical protein